MALRTSLVAQPHLYMGDTQGRPLDAGKVYFGEPNKDPELYPINVFYDEALTIAAPQPIRTMGGFMNANGQMVEVYAAETTYSVKVLDGYGRQVFYQESMTSENAELQAVKFDTGIIATAKYGGVSRDQSDKNADVVSIKDFGCVGGGVVNNDDALTTALNSGVPLFIPDEDFLYTQVVVDTDVVLTGSGRFVYSGEAATNPGYTATLVFNGAADIEYLNIHTTGLTDEIYDLASFESDNVSLKYSNLVSENQRNKTGGINFYGNNLNIGIVKSKNIARPTAFISRGVDITWRNNIQITALIADTYLRGTKFRYAENVSVGKIYVSGVWAGAVLTQGYNGVLCESVKAANFGDVYIADSLEHGFRFGCPMGTDGYHITSLTAKNTGGCGLKVNPQTGYFVNNGVIGSLTTINAGNGSSLGNTEALRLTAINNLQIGAFNGLERCTRGMLLADVTNLRVGTMYVENVIARVIEFNMNTDASSGNCTEITIDRLIAKCNTSARHAISGTYNSGRTINKLNIKDMYVEGHNNTAVNMSSCDISDSTINVRVSSSSSSVIFEGFAGKTVNTIASKDDRLYKGAANDLDLASTNTFRGYSLSLSTDNYDAAMSVSSKNLTSSTNAYGGYFSFGRLGSNRRGAAVAIKQTGTNNAQNGLSFMTQSTTTSSDDLLESMVLKHNGTVHLPRLPTSASGLSTGDIWNDGGTLKIV